MTPEDDPNAPHRRSVGIVAAGLMAVAAVTSDMVLGRPDGSHGPFLAFEPARAFILVLIAVLVWRLTREPNKPDVRVAKAGVLAATMVAIVVGLNDFLGALYGTPSKDGGAVLGYPGPAAWALLLAGMLLLYLRFRRDLWPASRWEQDIMAANARRSARR